MFLRKLAIPSIFGLLAGSLMFAAPAAAQETRGSGEEDVVGYIDRITAQRWSDFEVKPSDEATDGEWVRRVYLDILGRIPTVAETEEFVKSRDSDKKERLVEDLLNSDAYIEEYARNMTTIWTNLLIGRSGGTDDSMADRSGLQHFLRRSFLRNVPYDRMVYELLSAKGNSVPGSDEYNGAVNFLLNEIQLDVPPNERTARVTASVSRLFLGLQVQCTQCHNHPFNDWKQDQFWSMDAFFRQMQQVRRGRGNPVGLYDGDFAGELANPREAAIFYEQRNGLLKVAYPTFVDGTKIDPSGYVDEVNRREELAKMVTKSEDFRRAIVNRMWGHFMGYGFTKPVDDMGPHNRPSHPELLEKLAADFGYYNHDLKQLIKWITLSKPYSLSSQLNSTNERDDPELGEPPLFSHFYVRQMTAEQLYESLLTATHAERSGNYEQQEETKTRWLQQFVNAFGTDEGGEQTTFNGTIPQALLMMNSDLIKRATSTQPGTFLHKIATSNLKDSEKIKYLFKAGLSRDPDRDEVKVAQALWRARGGNTNEALKDIWWAVLNSNEFILQH